MVFVFDSNKSQTEFRFESCAKECILPKKKKLKENANSSKHFEYS